MIKAVLLLTISSFFSGCAYSIHEVHASDFTPYLPIEQSGEIISASASQFVVMGFVEDTNYVNLAVRDLRRSVHIMRLAVS